MLIGYARVSKTDGSQSLDLQRDALRAEGIDDAVNPLPRLRLRRPRRPAGARQLSARSPEGRRARGSGSSTALGRKLAHLVNTVQDLSVRGVGLAGARRPGRAGGR